MKHKKQILKTILLLLLPAFVVAQDYQPIPDSNAAWIIQQDDGYGGIYYHRFFLSPTKDDTAINSVNYTKLFARLRLPPSFYYGAFRNGANGKSYYIPAFSQQEYLLRDFTRNTGDTIMDVAYEQDWESTWVLDFYVDSTEFTTSGPYTYKIMYLSPIVDTIPDVDGEALVWMEKIGSFGGGVLNTHEALLSPKRLKCMQYNDTIYYNSILPWFRTEDITYEYGECADPVGIKEQDSKINQILVVPNPFGKVLLLNNLPDNYPIILSIFDLFGQVVFMKTLSNIMAEPTIVINPALPSGLYILTIRTNNSLLLTKKIFKK